MPDYLTVEALEFLDAELTQQALSKINGREQNTAKTMQWLWTTGIKVGKIRERLAQPKEKPNE